MLLTTLLSCLSLLTPTLQVVAPSGAPAPLAHTYSIVARDPVTGDMGVAVQSHYFSVGPTVPWAEAGVGAVATQSLVLVDYGPYGLDLMRKGMSARQALDSLLRADAHHEGRQVAMIDTQGRVAAFTGGSCIPDAGDAQGEQFSCQANLMANPTVWPAMKQAFESAKGDLAERMMQALEAAERAGGDIRGRQSAAMIVVKGKASGKPWNDVLVNLRVEDHDHPLVELRRLLRPGARAAVLDFRHIEGQLSWDEVLRQRFQQLYLRQVVVPAARFSGLEAQYAYLEESIARFPTADQQRQLALDAGFAQARHRPLAAAQMGVLELVA